MSAFLKVLAFLIGGLVVVASVVGALYISIWWGIVEPIMAIAKMIDTHSITATGVAQQVLYFLVRDILAVIVGFLGFSAGMGIIAVGASID